jgi:hypothetical protein
MRRGRSILFSLPGHLMLGLILGISCAGRCAGYSVFTHEAIVDAAWKDDIVPLLLSRFPEATPEARQNQRQTCFLHCAPGSSLLLRRSRKAFCN